MRVTIRQMLALALVAALLSWTLVNWRRGRALRLELIDTQGLVESLELQTSHLEIRTRITESVLPRLKESSPEYLFAEMRYAELLEGTRNE